MCNKYSLLFRKYCKINILDDSMSLPYNYILMTEYHSSQKYSFNTGKWERIDIILIFGREDGGKGKGREGGGRSHSNSDLAPVHRQGWLCIR